MNRRHFLALPAATLASAPKPAILYDYVQRELQGRTLLLPPGIDVEVVFASGPVTPASTPLYTLLFAQPRRTLS